MSVCSSGKCPAIVAMDAIRAGGYCDGGRVISIRKAQRGITGGGSGEADDSTTYMASQSSFRAAIAKMEVARDQMKGLVYKGDLMALGGQSRFLGACYLLSMRESLLTQGLIELLQGNPFTVDVCATYPAALHQTINEIAGECGVEPLQAPPVDIFDTVKGNFAVISSGSDWDNLHSIADDLLELSKICADIEIYHMQAAQKITEIMMRRV